MSQRNMGSDREPTTSGPPSTPRWVKVFGIAIIVLVLVVVIALVAGLGGPHGPGRHIPLNEANGTPSLAAAGTRSGRIVGDTPSIEHAAQLS